MDTCAHCGNTMSDSAPTAFCCWSCEAAFVKRDKKKRRRDWVATFARKHVRR